MAKTLIIAEAGVNHNGKLDLAYELVDVAVEAGADIVKFQTCKPEKAISRFADKAAYQKKTTDAEESQLDMIRRIALSYEDFVCIKKYCDNRKIKFLSTPFELDSIEFLENLGCSLWKIPSGEITNYPYLLRIAKTGKPVIMSTGMSRLEEIGEAVELLRKEGAGEIILLQCNTQYPTPFEDVHLSAMRTIAEKFSCKVGYSDHTLGIEIPIAAVAMGAVVIEKHFTLDKNMEGPDHQASLEPEELKAMIQAIRNTEKALGTSVKAVSASEKPNQVIARKSIVAFKNIKAGEVLTEYNVTTKRPGDGISPMRWNEIIGTKAIRDFAEDEKIEV